MPEPEPFPFPADGACVVLVTAPPGVAHDLARILVEERLAACVSVVPGLRSVYAWDDTLHDDPESQLIVKTRRERLIDLERRVREVHPYEIPEFLVLEPTGGTRDYLDWLQARTSSPPEDPEGA